MYVFCVCVYVGLGGVGGSGIVITAEALLLSPDYKGERREHSPEVNLHWPIGAPFSRTQKPGLGS